VRFPPGGLDLAMCNGDGGQIGMFPFYFLIESNALFFFHLKDKC
jgi:hypothetical protein